RLPLWICCTANKNLKWRFKSSMLRRRYAEMHAVVNMIIKFCTPGEFCFSKGAIFETSWEELHVFVTGVPACSGFSYAQGHPKSRSRPARWPRAEAPAGRAVNP